MSDFVGWVFYRKAKEPRQLDTFSVESTRRIIQLDPLFIKLIGHDKLQLYRADKDKAGDRIIAFIHKDLLT